MQPAAPPSAGDASPLARQPLAEVARVLLLVWAAYLAAALVALQMAIPPGYASPLYPAAGIALAAVLVYGRRVVPAVVFGAFSANLTLSALRGNLDLQALGLPALIALGAGAQAGFGAALVRRHARHPQALSDLRDVAVLFGLGALLACTVSASVATAALGIAGTVPRANLATTWFTWWAGDALGALIAAPVALTLIGRPRADWAARRLTVGLPLALVTVVLALGIAQVARWDAERLQNAFAREATNAISAFEARLHGPLAALEATRGVFDASDSVSRAEMQRATAAWLSADGVTAIGWYERLRRDEVPAFERRAHAEGFGAFAVFDRNDAPAPDGDEVIAMRFIEPMPRNAAALGLNALSVPAARAAIEASTRDDRPVASAGFRLTQSEPGEDRVGVVVYRAVFDGHPAATEAARGAALHGVVFVTLQPAALLEGLAPEFPGYLQLCLVDTDPKAVRRRLANAAGCEATAPGDLAQQRRIAFAGREWLVSVRARPGDVPESRDTNAWLFSLVGLLGTAMLGALLLGVTGRTRRIETAVQERTAALEREITERTQTEAALRDSEQRFRNIFNNVPIGVVYTDLEGNVKQTNPAFCEMLGYSADELASMTVRDYTHPEDWPQDVALAKRLLSAELQSLRRHKRLLASDGRTLWVQSSVSLLRDAQGRAHRIVGVLEDITEHLRLEEAERARERAESSNQAKSEFLSRMSHELRTPLNAMLGFAQLLALDQRHPLAESQRPWVAQIQAAGWHLLAMINDVLDLSRIEAGTLRLHPATLDLAELLAAARSMTEGEAERRGIVVTQDLADATRALGDATRVKQILTNLLSNAVKYNHDGGRIHIGARKAGDERVEIAVTDTGLGMSEEQLAALFQPFNRLGRERSAQQGTGIGLVISRRLAEAMGGTLRAQSVAGEGSSFVLSLPQVAEADTVRSELDDLPAVSRGYRTRIVHYVEDNETNIEVMRGILSQRPQVQLDVSVTGLDALAAIRQRRPDLILLDMHLPDIDGLELLRHLKAGAETAGIPVVVVSADAVPDRIETALRAGAMGYLTKPVSVSELLASVDDVLGQAHTRFG